MMYYMDKGVLNKIHLKSGRVKLSDFFKISCGTRNILSGGHIRLSESASLKPHTLTADRRDQSVQPH